MYVLREIENNIKEMIQSLYTYIFGPQKEAKLISIIDCSQQDFERISIQVIKIILKEIIHNVL